MKYPLPPSLLQSLLKASSPGAEALNGRLAMLGFVGIVATELATGRSLPAQLATTSGAAHAAALGLAVMAASLAPLLSGRVRPEQAFPSEVRRYLPLPGCSLAWLLGIACWVVYGAAAPCGLNHLAALLATAPPCNLSPHAERLVCQHPAALLLDRAGRDHQRPGGHGGPGGPAGQRAGARRPALLST